MRNIIIVLAVLFSVVLNIQIKEISRAQHLVFREGTEAEVQNYEHTSHEQLVLTKKGILEKTEGFVLKVKGNHSSVNNESRVIHYPWQTIAVGIIIILLTVLSLTYGKIQGDSYFHKRRYRISRLRFLFLLTIQILTFILCLSFDFGMRSASFALVSSGLLSNAHLLYKGELINKSLYALLHNSLVFCLIASLVFVIEDQISSTHIYSLMAGMILPILGGFVGIVQGIKE